MSDIIFLDVSPESAILNSNDASLPTKTRESDTNLARFVLKYLNTVEQRAYWSWPIPQQDDLGSLLGTAKLRIHWTANTVSTDNVQFGVRAGYIRDGEDIDKALAAEVLSSSSSFSGVPNQEQVTEINLSSLFSGLDSDKSARLVIQVSRKVGIASNLASAVCFQKSQLNLDFKSKLEVEGPVFSSVVITTSPETLEIDDFGKHFIVDTDAIGGDALLYLPNDNTLTSNQDGKTIKVSRKGANKVSVSPLAGGSTGIKGASSPVEFFTDGDSLDFTLVQSLNYYQIF